MAVDFSWTWHVSCKKHPWTKFWRERERERLGNSGILSFGTVARISVYKSEKWQKGVVPLEKGPFLFIVILRYFFFTPSFPSNRRFLSFGNSSGQNSGRKLFPSRRRLRYPVAWTILILISIKLSKSKPVIKVFVRLYTLKEPFLEQTRIKVTMDWMTQGLKKSFCKFSLRVS